MPIRRAQNGLGTIALLAITGIANAGIAPTIVLDDFDSDPNDDAGGIGVYSSIVFNNPFGQDSSFTLDTALDSGSDVGVVVFNSGIGVEQNASILYNNEGAGLNLDAGSLGATGFELDFLMVDQDFTFRIELGNNGDGPSGMGGVAFIDISVSAGGGQTVSASLGDFIISPGFDINDVDSVNLEFNLEDGAVASLDFIASEFRLVVPSPGSVALMGLGGMLITRRQRI